MYLIKWIKKNDDLWLFIIFVLAISIRLFYVTELRNILGAVDITNPDSWAYHRLALNLLYRGDYGRDLLRPPLYSHFLFVNYLLFGISWKAVRIIQAIINSLTCVILALTGKNLYSKKVGLFAGLGSALYPFFIVQTGEILTETLFLFLFSSFVFFLLSLHDTGEKSYAVLSGMTLGVTILCRAAAIILPPVLIVWFLIFSSGPFSRRVRQLFLTLVCMALVIAPWTMRNYVVLNRFIPVTTMGGWNFWMGFSKFAELEYLQENNAQAEVLLNELFRERNRNFDRPESLYYQKGLNYIRNHPQNALRLMIKKLMFFWNIRFPENYGWLQIIRHFILYIILPLLGIGGLFLFASTNKAKFFLFFLFFLFFSLVHMVSVSQFRYRITLIDPYLIVFASFLLTHVLSLMGKGKKYEDFDH